MIELGKTQCLNIVKVTDFGVYLGTEEDNEPEYDFKFTSEKSI